MIKYDLRCAKGHAFESWFQSSSAYDSQRKRKLVNCPTCGSEQVEKAIMAPRLAGTKKRASVEAASVSAPADETAPASLMMAQDRELRAKLKQLRDHVMRNADNVGKKFPTEARKMHYGDIEHRPIYGEASMDEAKSLVEEGIEVLPLPVLPEDRN